MESASRPGGPSDLERVEALLERIRRDPGTVASAEGLAAGSGLKPSELAALFRRHLQRTPEEVLLRARVAAARRRLGAGEPEAETAEAAGFPDGSTLRDAFRRYTGLTPEAYRRLGAEPSFVLRLPDGFLPHTALTRLGRDPESPSERVVGGSAVKAIRLPEGRAGLLRLELTDGLARGTVEAGSRPSPEDLRRGHEVALRLLGLGDDPGSFLRRLERLGLRRLAAGREGLRVPRTAEVFEGFTWAVVGQQVNLRFAYALRRRLIERCGRRAGEGLRAHPSAAEVAALDYSDLTRRQFSRRKAEYLIDLARGAVAGTLPVEGWGGMAASRLEERLLDVRGLGPWSAQYLMMMAYGLPDCAPLADAGLRAALSAFYRLDDRPGTAEVAARMEPFAPYRSLATYHLWTSLGSTG